ncbi:hypothetical protein BZB76_2611 [Actinomadura pelletieri DSM 43383]|uniref:Uncharacterized protein n=1 Tax=Actinomadura pelletieri DSM 43383 TaxID=1120940 RepID=A0A495QUZ8_9ACTN|nr:hypothetical protein [Actinomadura pelletieri]RKS77233.1 hypothetical protein BZB76_2611 [Actinomadura pelletieri DSM 43383]
MGQPSMRITVDAAMRARDVSRPIPDGDQAPKNDFDQARPSSEPTKRTKAAKNERRRLNKRGPRPTPSALPPEKHSPGDPHS